jgi:hypothetical protein
MKKLKMTSYRNTIGYEECILPVLQRLSNIEHLTLLLAISLNEFQSDRFIDGLDLERDIMMYMPHLHQFDFHIRSILRNASHISLDTILQSFSKQQSADCALDYFNNQYGQCQIYSLPFIGTRLDFISNRFPLFSVENRFSNISILLLYDDIKPFEKTFFQRITQALPRLKSLEIQNLLEQKEQSKLATNSIEFSQLTTLILHNIHLNYAEQLLCQSYLPCLIELVIRNDVLLAIIDQNQQQTKDNCSKVETLFIVEPWIQPTDVHLQFFPKLIV